MTNIFNKIGSMHGSSIRPKTSYVVYDIKLIAYRNGLTTPHKTYKLFPRTL